MPTEEVVERESSSPAEPTLADYRKERETGTPAAVTPETTEPAKTATDSEPVTTAENSEEEEAGTVTKPKGGFQRRIDKLTKEKSDLERAFTEAQQNTADLKTRLDALEKKNPEVRADARAEGDPKPKAEDFKVYEEFIESLGRWVVRQETKAANDAQQKTQREESEKQKQAAGKAQFDKFLGEMRTVREGNSDFDEIFSNTQIPDYIHNRLVRMEKGAEIAYALAKDKAALGKILELNEKALKSGDGDFSEAYWEFGSFVRSLAQKNSPTTATRPVSQAPTPISPVRGGEAVSEADADKLSLSDYRKGRESGKIR
jgi:flagellar biosynthesis chaperone FliJ